MAPASPTCHVVVVSPLLITMVSCVATVRQGCSPSLPLKKYLEQFSCAFHHAPLVPQQRRSWTDSSINVAVVVFVALFASLIRGGSRSGFAPDTATASLQDTVACRFCPFSALLLLLVCFSPSRRVRGTTTHPERAPSKRRSRDGPASWLPR